MVERTCRRGGVAVFDQERRRGRFRRQVHLAVAGSVDGWVIAPEWPSRLPQRAFIAGRELRFRTSSEV